MQKCEFEKNHNYLLEIITIYSLKNTYKRYFLLLDTVQMNILKEL